MMLRGLVIVGIVSALASPAAAITRPNSGLPYRIAAAPSASYSLDCRFRSIRLWGAGRVNQFRIDDRGPRQGRLPSDNARCVLVQTGGAGHVTLMLTKGKAVHQVRTERAGQPVRLRVA